MLFSLLTQSHAESYGTYVENSILNPNRNTFNEKVNFVYGKQGLAGVPGPLRNNWSSGFTSGAAWGETIPIVCVGWETKQWVQFVVRALLHLPLPTLHKGS